MPLLESPDAMRELVVERQRLRRLKCGWRAVFAICICCVQPLVPNLASGQVIEQVGIRVLDRSSVTGYGPVLFVPSDSTDQRKGSASKHVLTGAAVGAGVGALATLI